MTIIITSDREFTAPGLPVISNLIKDGLVLGIRPIQTTGVVDLSDNDAQLTPVGAPAMNANGVRVGPMNFYSTNVIEPRNLTYIAGFRTRSGQGLSGTTQVVGSLRGSTTESDGSGIYTGNFSGNPNYIGVNYWASEGNLGPRRSPFVPSLVMVSPSTTNLTTRWVWLAIVVDSDGLQGRRYACLDGGPLVSVDATGLTTDIANRNLGPIAIGAYEDQVVDSHWRLDIAEMFVYNRPLSGQEIVQQFADSKAYMASVGAVLGA